MLILAPKPPPTSGAMARTWCWPRPFIAAIIVLRMCGFCVDDQMVIVSLPGSQCASTPRGSIAFGTRRWFTMRWLITTSASANALSTAVLSIFEKSGATPVPLGTSATARLFGKVLVDDAGLAFHRRFGIDDDRQRIVRDDDRVGGIAREVAIGRDDDGHRLAGVAHHVDGDRVMRRRRKRRADRHRREHLRDVGAGVDRFDAVHLLGGAGVDRS